ncbi:hypothetical protein DES53_104382 [Roseimicrobium gellanilyticum]|uniref:Uncharacterized protein n=1 Tax=Roseimicrobium gellanilyticum TaxID=748857 RepID=A0A366HPW2_9BACT|nr:hypothetical protein [Roseimicrobium gellanilyticum]RBP44561.1 hypothetical protein DES53_104382 [Roseimicrobium gellanilyticum]
MKHLLAFSLLLLSSATLFAEWKIDAPVDKVEGPLKGEIYGAPFTLGKAEWSNLTLRIESADKQGNWPVSSLVIFVKPGEKKEWVITPDTEKNPHVHMKFAKKGAKFPGTLTYTGEYSMRLTVLSETADSARLAIHISLPDYKKSHLIGEFEAKMVKKQ